MIHAQHNTVDNLRDIHLKPTIFLLKLEPQPQRLSGLRYLSREFTGIHAGGVLFCHDRSADGAPVYSFAKLFYNKKK
jgi:hypothetical protein